MGQRQSTTGMIEGTTRPDDPNETLSSSSFQGTMNVRIISMASNRRMMNEEHIIKVSGKKGTLFFGSNCNPAVISQGFRNYLEIYSSFVDLLFKT